MIKDLENEESLKSYLLGDLNPDEQERLEQHLMTDSDAYEQLCWIEDELIDDYLEGSLSGQERERFETYFLAAPERRQKLSFAKSLKRYIAENKSKERPLAFWPRAAQAVWPAWNPILKWALAASLTLLVGGGSWSGLQISRLHIALDREQTQARESQRLLGEAQSQNSILTAALDDEKDRSSRFEQEVANLKKAQKPGSSLLPGQNLTTTVAITLTPLLRGSESIPKESIPKGTTLVQFDLMIDPLDYPQYQATLQRDEGDKIVNQTSPSIEGLFSGLILPAELMTPGVYVLNLRGITAAGADEAIGSFQFQVMPQ